MSKGAVQPDPTIIGEVAAPPFVRLPDPTTLFVDRTLRLRALAARSEIGPYLRFLVRSHRAPVPHPGRACPNRTCPTAKR